MSDIWTPSDSLLDDEAQGLIASPQAPDSGIVVPDQEDEDANEERASVILAVMDGDGLVDEVDLAEGEAPDDDLVTEPNEPVGEDV